MMQCPSCSAPLVPGEARCVACRALVNPPVHGASALAPRLVTPQNIDGLLPPVEIDPSPVHAEPSPVAAPARISEDDAWRREVLERVRKRRQARTHSLPLFVEGQEASSDVEAPSVAPVIDEPFVPSASSSFSVSADEDELIEELADQLEDVEPRRAMPAPDLLASLSLPLSTAAEDGALDLPLRPAEMEASAASPRARPAEIPSQSLVERPRPTLVGAAGAPRSLVADLPLVEPSRMAALPLEPAPRAAASTVNPRAASMNDRVQAAFIDMGMWSAMSVTAFYFASRIAHTPIMAMGPAWKGLTLFAVVLAAAYVLFFGGLSGATPGKIACGIQVKRYDGSSLGPLPSLARGFLGIFSVALLGLGVWPAFWDKDRRTLHDRLTGSRVTIV